jgi:curved DNA-binding protein CbpA
VTDDPFAILGLEPRFEIKAGEIRRRVMAESVRRHPDRAPDQVTAAIWTKDLARINEAADRLLDDLERAEALLRLRGGPGPSDDRSLPDGFLESMLSIRLELEEAIAAEDESGRQAIESWGRAEWAARRDAVARWLDGPEGAGSSAMTAVRRELNRWRYAQRMLEQLDGGDGAGGL